MPSGIEPDPHDRPAERVIEAFARGWLPVAEEEGSLRLLSNPCQPTRLTNGPRIGEPRARVGGARARRPDERRTDFEGLSNKALVLEKLGRAAGAAAAMDQALLVGNVFQIHQYGRRLVAARRGGPALQVFQLNSQKHPYVWPVNHGLARGCSAAGNYPAAIEALLKAQKQVPAGDTVNAAAIPTNIGKLKRGEDIN